jgi:hypothetical protein
MRAKDFITEGRNHPVIVVDVQPEYSGMIDGFDPFAEIIEFVNNQTGPVLMFVNAEDMGQTGDTVQDVMRYWEDTVRGEDYDWEEDPNPNPINWQRFEIVDKGYGYFRTWMDDGISPATIIRVIRTLYASKVNDSRMLFGGEDSEEYEQGMQGLVGAEFQEWMLSDPIIVDWTSVAQLKRFNGAYIVGGGRDECLREVELLMNAFNIKYRRIDSLVY